MNFFEKLGRVLVKNAAYTVILIVSFVSRWRFRRGSIVRRDALEESIRHRRKVKDFSDEEEYKKS